MCPLDPPPKDIVHPPFGKPNIELIILWMLNTYDSCTWGDLTGDDLIKKSTLSKHLNRLMKLDLVNKTQFNQYQITAAGQDRFIHLSQGDKPRHVNFPPQVITKGRNYEDIILWMLYNNTACQWKDFTGPPLNINQSSLSKTLRTLQEEECIEKENKEYHITAGGKSWYGDMLHTVVRRAKLAYDAGCTGVICSGLEAQRIKKEFGKDFLAVTPGIRPAYTVTANEDQQRITTPAKAIHNGSDYLVVGRPIRDADDPRQAAMLIAEEIKQAL